VEVDSRLIVGQRVSQAPNDKQELVPTVAAVAAPVASVAAVLTDSGFFSEKAVLQVEQDGAGQPTGTTVYAAMERKDHHRTVRDLERPSDPPPPVAGASLGEGRGDGGRADGAGTTCAGRRFASRMPGLRLTCVV